MARNDSLRRPGEGHNGENTFYTSEKSNSRFCAVHLSYDGKLLCSCYVFKTSRNGCISRNEVKKL